MTVAVAIPTIPKSVVAVLDYGIDLSIPQTPRAGPWLQPGEYVTSLTVTSSDPALVINSFGIVPNAAGVMALCVVWLSGGVLGKTYLVTFTFTTNEGRTDERSISIEMTVR